MPAIIGDDQGREAARIVLAHDWLVGMRGGERVLERLALLFGPTTLYTLVDGGGLMAAAIRSCEVRTSSLQRFPAAAGALRRWYLPLYRRAVEGIDVDACDLVISSSSAVIKSIRPPAGALHLCYCHSPARYLWDQADDYALGSRGALRAIGLRAMRRRFQRWDQATSSRVTVFVANSRHTAARIERSYDRTARVVYPPVRTGYFSPRPEVEREEWLLVVGALEPYKRTGLVIEAARRRRWPLKVIGTGSQFATLKRMSGPNVEMLGRVDDEMLRDHYRRAGALVFPQVEDFGIIAAEAQACGCPVIAFHQGGAAEIVTEGTGVLFHEHTVDGLAAAVETLEAARRRGELDCATCARNADRFSESRFDRAITAVVEEMLNGR